MEAIHWQPINDAIAEATGKPVALGAPAPVGGGDIHRAYQVQDELSGQQFFIKCNQPQASPVLLAESESLAAIQSTQAISVPQVFCSGQSAAQRYLVLSYIPLSSHGDEFSLGCQLAQMHQQSHSSFGFAEDNFIGLSPQRNCWHQHWLDFWVEERLQPQLELAYAKGFKEALAPLVASYTQRLAGLLGHQPLPALVHGDLWSGNKGFLPSGAPVIFDPACYYGDREVDLAMSELFGGFGRDFYAGYQSQWPLEEGYKQRKVHYNLYHLLNHLNLFGAGYLSRCTEIMRNA